MGFFDRFKSKPVRHRAVVIGLDGTPLSLLRRLADDGTMPTVRRLIGEGTLKHMTTTIPEISSVAWSSFMTGVNPGKHGVYGFIDLQPRSYKVYFPNFKHVKGDTIWDVIGRKNRRSVVVNVPSTYPAREMNGVLISGFVAIDLAKATFPPSLVPSLREHAYQIDVDARKIKESNDALMADVFHTLDRRRVVLRELFEREDWDLFVGVITETDRMQHFFWEAIEDPAHPLHARFRAFYSEVDDLIGWFASRIGGSDTLFLMSDHGFAPLDQQVYLNRWLVERGYLRFGKENPTSIEDIGPDSRAFVMDPARVYVNLKGKFPLGCVEHAEYRALRDELKREIAELTIDGQRVVARVFEKEEIFDGPHLESAPDLCVLPVKGFDLKGAVNKTVLADREVFTGMHTQDDALFWIGSSKTVAGDATIYDVFPTILAALGEVAPAGLDGRSLLEPQS
jgi:predicted AlkP superfamily phosphohydrolase/phosphomutase